MLPSPLMHTCFESREVALRRYKQEFGELLRGNNSSTWIGSVTAFTSIVCLSFDTSAIHMITMQAETNLSPVILFIGRRSCDTWQLGALVSDTWRQA
jgi:hypothetical protein